MGDLMRASTLSGPTGLRRPLAALLTVLLVASAACGESVPPASPGGTGIPVAPVAPSNQIPSLAPGTPRPAEPSATAGTATPHAADATILVPGALAETVTGDLRVRSEPRVADDSLEYVPLLDEGTQLVVTGGPVDASGYTWIRVAPTGVTLRSGSGRWAVDVDQGWVAIADHDGTPWVGPASDPTPGLELASATVTRPAPVSTTARAAADAQNAFGLDLYRRMIRDPSLGLDDRSVVMSPTSVMMALSMARAGARGDTAAELDQVLGLDGWTRYATGLGSLDQVLRSRDATWSQWQGAEPSLLALRMANQAFAQEGYALEPAYLERVAGTFGAPLALVDYAGDPQAALDAINGWVSRQTLGRIPKLLSPSDINELTRLVLVNAIYLKARWATPFSEGLTRDLPFTTLTGARTAVPTMRMLRASLPVASGDGWLATELRYASPPGEPGLSMILILPDDLARFERGLDAGVVDQISAGLAREWRRLDKVSPVPGSDCNTVAYATNLYLPRFGIDTRGNLVPSLQGMGMSTAATTGADFSGMTGHPDLHIGVVIHQANIDVDEEGTEAAAATAVVMDRTAGCGQPQPREIRTLRLNRPFLFLLRDQQTGAVLFMGRVADPTAR